MNGILLGSTTKAHAAHCPFPDGTRWADLQVALGWEQLPTEPRAPHSVKLYPRFSSEVFFRYGYLKSARNPTLFESLGNRARGKRRT